MQLTLGQVARERAGREAYLVGLTTYEGHGDGGLGLGTFRSERCRDVPRSA
jgi:hypothetical protein